MTTDDQATRVDADLAGIRPCRDPILYHVPVLGDHDELEGFWAVVPAGGAGSRLWPMSRSRRPKFLLDIAGTGRSLLQAAWDRLMPLCGNRFMVVTGEAHREAVAEQIPSLSSDRLLTEPTPRDSMAAIGRAAAVLEDRDPSLIIGSFPADHVIPDVSELHDRIRQGYAAAQTGLLALIGIRPTRPTPALGYIRMGEGLGLADAPLAREVAAFVEKPSPERARELVDDGGYLWNAGMWIAQAGTLMGLLADAKPKLAEDLRRIVRDPASLPQVWERIERTTIDHSIAEPLAGTDKICVVPASFEWEDIGDYGALSAFLNRRKPSISMHSLAESGKVVDVDSTGVAVSSTGRVIAVVGVPDVVVVDTDDALLVMSTEYAQRLKDIYHQIADSNPEVG